jgi:hypothetical protein
MLSVIAKYLTAKLETFEYLDKVYGLSTFVTVVEETVPAVYVGSELRPINFDSYKSLIYIQQNGRVGRDTEDHPAVACAYLTTERYPLRLIIYAQGRENINCDSYSQEIASAVKAALNGKQKQLETAANLMNATITFSDTDLDKNSVWASQFSIASELKDTDILVSLDLEFEIMGDDTCFAGSPCENSDFVFDITSTTFCQRVTACLANILSSVKNIKFNIDNEDADTGDYQNILLSGLTPDIDFLLFSDEGSGTLLKVNDGYTFSGTTITALNGNYRLQIVGGVELSSSGTVSFTIGVIDFSGGTYTNALLSGLTPMVDFNITNLGSGTVKTVNVDYTFAGSTISGLPPDDYLIEIY